MALSWGVEIDEIHAAGDEFYYLQIHKKKSEGKKKWLKTDEKRYFVSLIKWKIW